jgi:phage baseplate assembly protein W
MAQFPDVEHAVSAVQEILNTPYGTHIREYSGVLMDTMSPDLMP